MRLASNVASVGVVNDDIRADEVALSSEVSRTLTLIVDTLELAVAMCDEQLNSTALASSGEYAKVVRKLVATTREQLVRAYATSDVCRTVVNETGGVE